MVLRISQIFIICLLAFLSLFVGSADIAVTDFFEMSDFQREIFWLCRLPRLLTILITGSSLAIAGLIMQCITCNRFVSPTTAGTMEWCRLGVMIAMIYFVDATPTIKILLAFLISLFGTSIFLSVIQRIPQRNIIIVPLVGMMLGAVVSAISTYFGYINDVTQNMASRLQGNFSLVIEGEYEMIYISLPFLLLAYLYSDRFTIAGMGRSLTVTLGLNHAHIVRVGLIIVAISTSISIVSVGNIPFIGLIVPNLVSMIRGDSVKSTIFDTAWLGAILVLACDVVGRLIIAPAEVPIGIILSVFGSIIFLIMLLNRRSYA